MGHFWVEGMSASAREALGQDWVDDLLDFPVAYVEEACRRWRRQSRYRPTPFDIRALCIEQEREARRAAEYPALPPPDTCERIAAERIRQHRAEREVEDAAAADRDALARLCGFLDFGHLQSFGIARATVLPSVRPYFELEHLHRLEAAALFRAGAMKCCAALTAAIDAWRSEQHRDTA
jgi:hypothetical protein